MSNSSSGGRSMGASSVALQVFAYTVLSAWNVFSSLPSVTSKLFFILQRPSFNATS